MLKNPAFRGHEKAGIAVEGADNFYQEIVIENTLTQKERPRSSLETGCRGEGYD